MIKGRWNLATSAKSLSEWWCTQWCLVFPRRWLMVTKAATFTETAHWSSRQAMWHFKKTVCCLFKDSKLMSVLERSVKLVYYSHLKCGTSLSPVLADVSPAAGSSLMSLGSIARGLLMSVSEGPLWGGTGKSSGWERSASNSRPSCFIVALPLLPSTMQSSCSSEAPSNTLLSSEGRDANTFKTTSTCSAHTHVLLSWTK